MTCECISFTILVIIVIIIICLIFVVLTSEATPNIIRDLRETIFFTSSDFTKSKEFPQMNSVPTLDLSIVIPSFNEEERLPKMLDEALAYLSQSYKGTYELIIVDDGSRDKTSHVGLTYTDKYGSDTVRVLTLVRNRGKGGAVREGVFRSRGRAILFADADGATVFSDLAKLTADFDAAAGTDNVVVCGSRAHLEAESIATRSLFRTFLMHAFHFLVNFLCVRGVRDTQCGFKLLSRPAALTLFRNLHVERWAFDVELLYIAQRLNMLVIESAVHWEEVDGSKMVPVLSWIQMGRDLLLIRLKHMLGAWRITDFGKAD